MRRRRYCSPLIPALGLSAGGVSSLNSSFGALSSISNPISPQAPGHLLLPNSAGAEAYQRLSLNAFYCETREPRQFCALRAIRQILYARKPHSRRLDSRWVTPGTGGSPLRRVGFERIERLLDFARWHQFDKLDPPRFTGNTHSRHGHR